MAHSTRHFATSSCIKPDFADARYTVGLALLAAGDRQAARAETRSLEPLNPQLAARLKRKVN